MGLEARIISILIFLICILPGPDVAAQGCPDGLLYQENTTLEYKTYKKKKSKPTYISRHQVIKLQQLEDRTLAHIKCGIYERDGDLEYSFDYFIGCKDDKLIIDKAILGDPDNLVLFDDKEFSFDGKNIHYPANAKPGDTLRQAAHIVEVNTGPVKIATIATDAISRIVEAEQNVVTPAGTFRCLRISYVTELKRGSKAFSFTSRNYIVEFVTPGLGVVRSEVRKKSGKLKTYTQLEKLENPKTTPPDTKI